MHVQVRDAFASVRAVVDHDPESLGKFQVRGHLSGDEQKVPEERFVPFPRVADPGDGLAGNYQKMNRSLGLNVTQNDAAVVLVEEVTRDLSGDNFFEQGFLGHGETLPEEPGRAQGCRSSTEQLPHGGNRRTPVAERGRPVGPETATRGSAQDTKRDTGVAVSFDQRATRSSRR